jgi:hypothetical protein
VRIIAARTDALVSNGGYKLRSTVTVTVTVATGSGSGPSPLKDLEEFRPDVVHVHNLFPNWGTGWLDGWEGPFQVDARWRVLYRWLAT